jgi:hypothetical protein
MKTTRRPYRPAHAARAAARAAWCRREARELAAQPLVAGDWSTRRDRRARIDQLLAEAMRLDGLSARMRGDVDEYSLPI